ncbi:hypothetical protein [Enteractinococcus helveticum]|uniref:Uncharacterized protein n=1 Tax=Enteractinococcus helveticum TaxID=1837282 RepID=A0A1B7M1U9_9MICC|nr:hypothetical protein [Enteractinococcus helveticum]OAV62572.1 hypothetical protein A6F49_06450 [Enteractinococcus helveticum]
MEMDDLRRRAARLSWRLLDALQGVETQRSIADVHLAAEGMGYAGVLVLLADVAADLTEDHGLRLPDDLLDELGIIAKESGDGDLRQAHQDMIAALNSTD